MMPCSKILFLQERVQSEEEEDNDEAAEKPRRAVGGAKVSAQTREVSVV